MKLYPRHSFSLLEEFLLLILFLVPLSFLLAQGQGVLFGFTNIDLPTYTKVDYTLEFNFDLNSVSSSPLILEVSTSSSFSSLVSTTTLAIKRLTATTSTHTFFNYFTVSIGSCNLASSVCTISFEYRYNQLQTLYLNIKLQDYTLLTLEINPVTGGVKLASIESFAVSPQYIWDRQAQNVITPNYLSFEFYVTSSLTSTYSDKDFYYKFQIGNEYHTTTVSIDQDSEKKEMTAIYNFSSSSVFNNMINNKTKAEVYIYSSSSLDSSYLLASSSIDIIATSAPRGNNFVLYIQQTEGQGSNTKLVTNKCVFITTITEDNQTFSLTLKDIKNDYIVVPCINASINRGGVYPTNVLNVNYSPSNSFITVSPSFTPNSITLNFSTSVIPTTGTLKFYFFSNEKNKNLTDEQDYCQDPDHWMSEFNYFCVEAKVNKEVQTIQSLNQPSSYIILQRQQNTLNQGEQQVNVFQQIESENSKRRNIFSNIINTIRNFISNLFGF